MVSLGEPDVESDDDGDIEDDAVAEEVTDFLPEVEETEKLLDAVAGEFVDQGEMLLDDEGFAETLYDGLAGEIFVIAALRVDVSVCCEEGTANRPNKRRKRHAYTFPYAFAGV